MTPFLLVTAALAGWATGRWARRSAGWSASQYRTMVVALTLPWFALHFSVARLARSASLNPVRRATEPWEMMLADAAGPLLMLALLATALHAGRRTRILGAALPLVGEMVLWWVSVPLYHRLTLRGWFFVTEGLAGPLPLAFNLGAWALLTGYVMPRPGR